MRAALVALLFLSLGACHAPVRQEQPARVLFVGNSLTYFGNVPAIYSALAAANGEPADADMIVQGGATLAQRVADHSVGDALAGRRYTALVLQERGGDLLCAFGPDSCADSRQAIRDLSDLASRNGVGVVLLGTYQSHPAASQRLVEAEAQAADEAGIAYVEVSETLRRLRNVQPELDWFAADGMHPGKDLALLNAVLVYRALHGALPAPGPLMVKAPIYGSGSGLEASLRPADAAPPRPGTPMVVHYPARTMEALLAHNGPLPHAWSPP